MSARFTVVEREMAEERTSVAKSERYRRRTRLEWLGEVVGRAVPQGALRGWLRSAYRAALRLRGAGGGAVAELPGGELVRVLPEYRFLTWNPAEYQAFRQATRPGGVVLDVGANVGAYSMLFGHWVRPEGSVYAFEPAPEAFDGLVSHLEANHLRGIVTALPIAVAAASGTLEFAAEGVHGTGRLGTGPLRVEAVSIDDFCAREGVSPSVIKVDVEGAELDVLRGARETIRRGRGRLALFVEMHPTLWRETGRCSRDEMLAELARQGLRAEPLSPVDDPWAREGECMRLVPV